MWWFLLMLSMVIVTITGIIYLTKRIAKFYIVKKIAKNRKNATTIGVIVNLTIALVLLVALGIWNMLVCFIHLLVFWLLCDGATVLIRKRTKREGKYYIAGVVAVIGTVCYLGMGYFYAHHVFTTRYEITTNKMEQPFRVVGFSDSHVGTTFHGEDFFKYVEQMNAEKPDVVVIVGDFVDDDTSYEDMVKSCEALGGLHTKYGVYFVFGNHDSGYYAGKRGYGAQELVEQLEKNRVIVLKDDVVRITDELYLCGRLDKTRFTRKEMEELRNAIPEEGYCLVLDHQPNDYEAEKKAKADLVLSGHTHGGQLLPINSFGKLFGLNDRIYGYEKRENTSFIVSSGISDWTIKFKTGCISEYFVVDIIPEK